MTQQQRTRPEGWLDHWADPGQVIDGQTHTADPTPGWRCACGALTLVMCIPWEPRRGDHRVVYDEVSAADPSTPVEYLARYQTVNAAIWSALVERAPGHPALLERLVDRAQLTLEGETPSAAHRWTTLLEERMGLTEADLLSLLAYGRVPDAACVAAILSHPRCSAAVLTRVLFCRLGSSTSSRQETVSVLELVSADPRSRQRGAAGLARLTSRPEGGYGSKKTPWQRCEEAVAALDAFGEPGWRAFEALRAGWRGSVEDLTAAVVATLAAPIGH